MCFFKVSGRQRLEKSSSLPMPFFNLSAEIPNNPSGIFTCNSSRLAEYNAEASAYSPTQQCTYKRTLVTLFKLYSLRNLGVGS